jgi:hypothetical protein
MRRRQPQGVQSLPGVGVTLHCAPGTSLWPPEPPLRATLEQPVQEPLDARALGLAHGAWRAHHVFLPRLDLDAVFGGSQHGKAMRAVQPLPSGTRVFPLTGSLTPWPDHYTLHMGTHTHLRPDGHLWRYRNHACAPTCRIDFRTWTLVTTRALQGQEELPFNSLTTAWAMAAPCVCPCGVLHCYGWVAGFKYLTPAQHVRRAPQCSPPRRGLWRAHATPPWRDSQ